MSLCCHTAAASRAFQGISSSGVTWEGGTLLASHSSLVVNCLAVGESRNKERLVCRAHLTHSLTVCTHSTHGHLHPCMGGRGGHEPWQEPCRNAGTLAAGDTPVLPLCQCLHKPRCAQRGFKRPLWAKSLPPPHSTRVFTVGFPKEAGGLTEWGYT